MTLSFHRWYDRFVPDPQPLAGPSPLLLAVKFQLGFAAQRYADLLFADDASRLHALPFVLILPDRLVFPARAESFGSGLLGGVAQALEQWRAQKAGTSENSIDLLTEDARVVALAQRAMHAPFVVPALSSHGAVLTDHDRYASASRYLSGRRCVDLNPGTGYSLSIMRRTHEIDGEWTGGEARDLAAWFGFLHEPAAGTHDTALALNLPAENVAGVVERMRAARQIVSTHGETGAATLRELGFAVEPLRRPALGHALPDEWLGVRDASISQWQGSETAAPAFVSERPLRVLFMVRSTAGEAGGWGDIVQVQRTAAALRKRGHLVELTDTAQPPPDQYDVVHLTRLTGEQETLHQARAVRDFPGPVCLMPIFNDHAAETVWGMQAAMIALWDGTDDAARDRNLGLLKDRAIQFTDGHGRTILPPPARNELTPGSLHTEREILRHVDLLIANAYGEVRAIHRHVDCSVPFAVVPTSADTGLYQPAARDAFVQKYGLSDFILSTGRIESRKNQVLLMMALARDADRPLVLIGGSVVDQYPTLLRALWTQNTIVFPNLPEEELAGAYAAARVVALPSWDEVASLSSLNAAACGASLVLSRNGFELEYFRDDAEYCDPADTQSIAAAVERAWSTHGQRAQRREELRERVAREYSWDRTAELTEAAYYRALAFNPRGELRRSRAHV